MNDIFDLHINKYEKDLIFLFRLLVYNRYNNINAYLDIISLFNLIFNEFENDKNLSDDIKDRLKVDVFVFFMRKIMNKRRVYHKYLVKHFYMSYYNMINSIDYVDDDWKKKNIKMIRSKFNRFADDHGLKKIY